jgi:outer membrane protein assembly factor BamB
MPGGIPEKVLAESLALAEARASRPDEGAAASASRRIFEQNLNNEVFEISASGAKRKIFSGFPSAGKIDVPRAPVFYKGFVYAGLTTGELVKINPGTREIVWIADIFKETDMLGGGPILDIAAPVVVDKGRIFAGGLGGSFCEVDPAGGNKKWCADIAVAAPFFVSGDLAFVVSAEGALHALDLRGGAAYWVAKAPLAAPPELKAEDGGYFVVVGGERFDAATGGKI